MKTNDGKKIILLLCILILAVIAVAVAIIQIGNRVEGNESHNSSYMGAIDYQRQHETVYINGEPYTPRKGVSSVLVIGVDTLGKAVGSDSYNNSEKADFLALIVFDDKNEKYTATVYDKNLNVFDSFFIGGDVLSEGIPYEKYRLAEEICSDADFRSFLIEFSL